MKHRVFSKGAGTLAIAMLLAGALPAMAGNPGQCTQYANQAVQQQGQNIAKGCGFTGPRWQQNWPAHFAWCMAAHTPQINAERNARTSMLASCSAPSPVVKFNNPKVAGVRLDWCRLWASQCGGPAAKAWCNTKGYAKADSWSKANNIGNWTNTRVIGTGQICSNPTCDGFKWIKCKN